MLHKNLQFNSTTGLITGAEYFPSPNFNSRPDNTDINLFVVHGISLPPGDFTSTDVIEFFQNKLDCTKHPYYESLRDMKVSAHLFIRRNGQLLQFVPLHLRAWHAGESIFQGRNNCNDYSIGVELEGTDDIPYTTEQYLCLVDVVKLLQKHYPSLSLDRIVGHSDIAPIRKTDPGPAFDWQRLHSLLRG